MPFLKQELLEATFVDCMELIKRVRNIKTDKEIEILRRSVEIQDQAHDEVFENAKSDDIETELHTWMVRLMIERGPEWAHSMIQSKKTSIFYGGKGRFPSMREI